MTGPFGRGIGKRDHGHWLLGQVTGMSISGHGIGHGHASAAQFRDGGSRTVDVMKVHDDPGRVDLCLAGGKLHTLS